MELLDPDQNSRIYVSLHSTHILAYAVEKLAESSNQSTHHNIKNTNVKDDNIFTPKRLQNTSKSFREVDENNASEQKPIDGSLTSSVVGGSVATSTGADLAVGAVALAGVAGEWLSAFSSPSATSSSATTTLNNNGGGSGFAGLGTPLSWLESLAVASGAALPPPSQQQQIVPPSPSADSMSSYHNGHIKSPPGSLTNSSKSNQQNKLFSGDLLEGNMYQYLSFMEHCIWVNSLAVATTGLNELIIALSQETVSSFASLPIMIQVRRGNAIVILLY